MTAHLKREAFRLGFTLNGICPAVAPTGVSRLADWLDRGYAGQMSYIASRQDAYSHPRHVLDGCRSIFMLGLPYAAGSQPPAPSPQPLPPAHGLISRYACSDRDYHDTIHDKLKQLIASLHAIAPTATARGVVDTAPLLEREFAQLAGLGWIGKHTLLIQKPVGNALRGVPQSASAGSYFFLAAILTDLELNYDEPFTADHCGACRACLDACPTNAFPQPYVLDATRCISYLTIELRDHIPQDLRPGIGNWLFGCDICQDVCPWNQRAEVQNSKFKVQSEDYAALKTSFKTVGDGPNFAQSAEQNGTVPFSQTVLKHPLSQTLNFEPGTLNSSMDLIALFDLDDAEFRRRFRHTPLWRPRRRGVLRNAAIVLGNQRAADAVPALIRGLNDPEPLIRGAAAWALGQIGGSEARAALEERQRFENDASVRDEIDSALCAVTSPGTQY